MPRYIGGAPLFVDKKMSRPAMPDPTEDPQSLRQAVIALKEAVEILQGFQRTEGNNMEAAVRWKDLVRLGLVPSDQVPTHMRRPNG